MVKLNVLNLISRSSEERKTKLQKRMPPKKVVVTGFGVFRNYDRNPSWEAVKLMQISGVELIKIYVPVEYEAVDDVVSRLWEEHNPDLVVHCGVSWLAEGIVLEKIGNGHDYHKEDVKGCKPGGNCPSQSICTKLNLDHVCQRLNQSLEEGLISIPAATSQDAGRYLCEYIYYKSLERDASKTVFIHVPEENKHKVSEVARSLELAVECLLHQIPDDV